MLYIIIGVLGFLVGYAWEHPGLAQKPWLRRTTGLLMSVLFLAAIVPAALDDRKFPLPPVLSLVSWPLFIIFTLLFIYSILIEIPLKRRNLPKGGGVVKTGTYALVRHPGLIFSSLFIVFLVLAARSWIFLIAAPIWMMMELIWVCIEDKFYFPRSIPGYEKYKEEVPMLFPTAYSFRRCIATIIPKGGKEG